ncbi:MFS transporter [Nonomuraea typhae]|uniref:MFS transporter n=1 Tax=Nonomuraea typhae TaxID=2603600 RepID=UPI0012F8DD19|nr:MFS transporter [Nonomuraea typhae]
MRAPAGRSGVLGHSRAVRLLMVNQLTINVGFYMLMPYLAGHLTGDLGLAVWVAALVLGVRNLCQQGLFLVGGSLADRVGYKPMILAGLALRTVGFGMLGVVEGVPGLIVASALTGLAGALFNPAARAYLAAEAGERKVEAFALFNVFYQTGILVGPLAGVLLNGLAFRVTCLTAAGLFAVLGIAQARMLPARRGSRAGADGSVVSDWRAALTDRAFCQFALAMTGSYVLGFQVYLSLPLAAPAQATWIFVVSGAMAMLGQLRVTKWAQSRWSPGQAMSRGLALMALAFALPGIAATGLPGLATPAATGPPAALSGSRAAALGGGDGAMAVAVIAATVLLTLGSMIVYPFEMATVAGFGGDRVGTYYGLYSTVSGVGTALGNVLTGVAMEAGLAWWGLVGVGLGSALAVHLLYRSRHGISTERVEPAADTG